MAIAGTAGTPSNGFTLRNGELVRVGMTQNKHPDVVQDPLTAARMLQFDPTVIVQLDVRKAIAETELRRILAEWGIL